jgi:DNA-binding transcriptional ArsR family regulator
MAKKKFQPAPVKMIEDLESIKVISDPLRVQILEAMAAGPQSVKQIAEKLGLTTSKLYYHFNMLEKHGFIKVTDKATRGNIVEKFYWVTAFDFRLDKAVHKLSGPSEPQHAVSKLLHPLDVTRHDVIRSMEARAHALEHGKPKHPRPVKAYREMRCIPDDRAQEFMERLNALTDEFEAMEQVETSEDAVNWAFTVLLYPSFYFETNEENE